MIYGVGYKGRESKEWGLISSCGFFHTSDRAKKAARARAELTSIPANNYAVVIVKISGAKRLKKAEGEK